MKILCTPELQFFLHENELNFQSLFSMNMVFPVHAYSSSSQGTTSTSGPSCSGREESCTGARGRATAPAAFQHVCGFSYLSSCLGWEEEGTGKVESGAVRQQEGATVTCVGRIAERIAHVKWSSCFWQLALHRSLRDRSAGRCPSESHSTCRRTPAPSCGGWLSAHPSPL